jgi:hypothetical protein
MRSILQTWLAGFAFAVSSCQYPAANPGEPDGAETSRPQGAVSSSDLQTPRATKLLKCLCSDIIAPSSRKSYPILANEVEQRQERCIFQALDDSGEAKRPFLEVKVARVLAQQSYSQVVERWKARLPVDLKVTESKPNANDVQSVVEGEDGDYKVRAIALYKSQSGILITTEENAAKTVELSRSLPPAYLSNVAATYPSLCE